MNDYKIEKVNRLKRLRVDISGFRDENFSQFSNKYEYQILSWTIGMLFTKIKEIDTEYYGVDTIKSEASKT